MKPIRTFIMMFLASCLIASQAHAVVLDKMDNADNFYMYEDKQVSLNATHEMPGYIVLTKTKGSENFIRWSRPDKQPIRIGNYDTLEIDLPDFGSGARLQILIEFFNNGRGGKGVSGMKYMTKGINTRKKKTLKYNLPEFAKANGVTGDYNGFRLMFRHTGDTNPKSTIKLDEIRLTDSKLKEQANNYVPKMTPPKPFMFGIGTHLGKQFVNETPEHSIELAKQAGFSHIRDEILWRDVEKKKGEYQIPAYAKDMIDLCEKQNIQPLIILLYGNAIHDKNLGHPKEGEPLEAYIRYAEFVVGQLKGRVKTYEIWNEWDMGLGYPRQKNGKRIAGDPVEYANFVKAVYPRLKAIDPDAKFLAGGHAALSLRHSDWFERCLGAGLANYCDGLSMHTYTRPYDSPEYWYDWVTQMQIRFSEQFNGGEPLPFYITETAWYTKSDAKVDHTTQAQFLSRMYLMAKTRPFIRGIWYFHLSGNPVFQTSYKFMPLPPLVAAHDIKDIVEEGVFLKRVDVGDPSIWILKFKMPDGKIKHAMWSTTPMEYTERRWDSPIVGQAMLHLKYTGTDAKPASLNIKQVAGMQFDRSWGKRLKRHVNEFDYTLMDLPLGPMPIIVEGDFDHITIESITPPVNKIKSTGGEDLHGEI
ncbi:MAG: hypothetical protein ACF8OB_00170 [Phycisphaeraceae bacterium JB051]